VSLTNSPTIGLAPAKAGFGNCGTKKDAQSGKVAAVLVKGTGNLTFKNGTVQCISGDGFALQSTTAGDPTLTIDKTTIQNTEAGIVVNAGTATITNASVQFNFNGVEQNNASTVDLSGGGNAVICSSSSESVVANQTVKGVDVLNTSTNVLNASNVAWDTTGPDVFSCGAGYVGCVCQTSGGCTNTAGQDDMDAVYIGTGAITTTGNSQSTTATAAGCK